MEIPVIDNSRQKQVSILGLIFFGLFILIISLEEPIIEIIGNRKVWALTWIFSFLFAFILFAWAKFSRKFKQVGNLKVSNNILIFQIGNKIEFEKNIEEVTLDINNYRGKEYFAMKSIYPFHDGRNNFITLNQSDEKFELLIENKKTYNRLQQLAEEN